MITINGIGGILCFGVMLAVAATTNTEPMTAASDMNPNPTSSGSSATNIMHETTTSLSISVSSSDATAPTTDTIPLSTDSLSTMTSISTLEAHSAIDDSNIENNKYENISEEERRKYLQELQAQTTLTMIPAMIAIILMAVIGVFGNSLVLYVYSRKFALNGTRVFILMIAAFDLVTNVVIIPGEVYDMFHIWDFDKPWVCRIRLYMNALTTMVSAQLLTALAVVRYRKVCVPIGWQISARQAKIIAVVVVCSSVLFSIPYGIINGRYTRPTPRPDIHGYECTVDDSYVDTVWPLFNAAFFILLFLANSSTIVVLYSLVGAKAWRHSKTIGKGISSSSTDGPSSSDCTGTTSSTLVTKAAVSDKPGGNKYEEGRKMSGGKTNVKISSSYKTVTFSNKKGLKEGATQNKGDKETQSVENCRINDDKNTIEYFTDDENIEELSGGTRAAGYSPRPRAGVNLSMVRELTVKLRAVQRQNSREEEEQHQIRQKAQGQSDEEVVEIQNFDDNTTGSDVEKGHEKAGVSNLPESTKKHGTKTVQFQNTETLREVCERGEGISENERNVTSGKEERAGAIHSGEEDLGSGGKQSTNVIRHERENSQGQHRQSGDAANNNRPEKSNSDKIPMGPKSGSSEKIRENHDAIKTETDNLDSRQEPEEPMSDFARAMQWVDITYCLKDDNAEEEEAQEDKMNSTKVSKSNSRKISRDNSFLKRNRKFSEALSDTLTRARKNKTLRKTSSTPALKDATSADDCNQARLTRKESTKLQAGVKPRRTLTRTTVMLIAISAVYILCFLPHLALRIYFKMNTEDFEALDSVGLTFYNLFLRSFFLNSASNAVIYGICDLSFREKCASSFRKKLECLKS